MVFYDTSLWFHYLWNWRMFWESIMIRKDCIKLTYKGKNSNFHLCYKWKSGKPKLITECYKNCKHFKRSNSD
jgi:hypothetical protein